MGFPMLQLFTPFCLSELDLLRHIDIKTMVIFLRKREPACKAEKKGVACGRPFTKNRQTLKFVWAVPNPEALTFSFIFVF